MNDIEIIENALMFYAEEGISTDKDAQTELDNAWIRIKDKIEGYEVPYTGGDSALSPDDLEELS